MLSLVRNKPKDSRSAAKSRTTLRNAWATPLSAVNRRRIAQALARRAARERLMLALLLYERMRPTEVADVMGVSPRQVGRTYDAMIAELQQSIGRRARRSLASRGRNSTTGTRLRKAA